MFDNWRASEGGGESVKGREWERERRKKKQGLGRRRKRRKCVG